MATKTEKAVALLNSLLKADRAAIECLVENRVVANARLGELIDTVNGKAGLLGVINGLLDSVGLDMVTAIARDGQISHFEVASSLDYSRIIRRSGNGKPASRLAAKGTNGVAKKAQGRRPKRAST